MRSRGSWALLLCLLPAVSSAKPLERYPTTHRFGISLGVGFGSASLSSFHQCIDDTRVWIERQGLKLDSAPKSGSQVNAEVGLRYYFPYHVLAHVGYGAVYNRASTGASVGPIRASVRTDQLVTEVPLLIGGYHSILGRLYVFGALGPSPFFYARSWISADPGGNSLLELSADAGLGFHLLLGAELLVTRAIAVGLELRYRYLKTGDLRDRNLGVLTSGVLGGDSNRTYALDLSGISLGITVRPFVR